MFVVVHAMCCEVNSVEGDAHLMKEELKNAQELNIRFRRAEAMDTYFSSDRHVSRYYL